MMSTPRSFGMIALLASAACAGPESIRESTSIVAPMPAAVQACSNTGNAMTGINAQEWWDCEQIIPLWSFAGLSTADRETIEDAIAQVNSDLDATTGAPQFEVVSGSGIEVYKASGNGTGNWCGATLPLGSAFPTTMYFYRPTSAACGPLFQVALQELTGLLGIHEQYEDYPSLSNCASSLFALNSAAGLCQWEIEAIYYEFGIRGTEPAYQRHTLTSMRGLDPQSAQVNQTVTVQIADLVADRPANNSCPAMDDGDCIFPAGATSIAWGVTGGSVQILVQNDQQFVFKALQAGTFAVTALPEEDEFNVAAKFSGNVATVTVTPAPAIAQIAAGNNVSVPVGTSVSPQPRVRVLASDGATPVQGVPVTFGSPSGGSTLSQPNQVTDASGYATLGAWTLGSTQGGYSMTATIGAAGVSPNPLTFNATATAPQTVVTVAAGAGGQGGGVVTSTTPAALAINCTITVSSSSGTCSGSVNTGTAVTLSAAANLGYKLSAWGVGCSGSATTCNPSTAGSSVSVTAAFIVKPFASLTRLECEPSGSQRRQQLMWATTGYPAGTTVTVITNTVNNTGTATTIGSAVPLSQGAGWWTPFLSNTANRYIWARVVVSGATSTWTALPVILGSGPCPLF